MPSLRVCPRIAFLVSALAPVLAVIGLGAAARADTGCQLGMVASVPLIPAANGNKALVDVTLNGVPARLIVDTGSESLAITETVYHRAATDRPIGSLLASGDDSMRSFATGIGGARLGNLGDIARLQIGNARGAFRAGIADDGSFGGADGLLGMSVLGDFDIDFDLQHRDLRLFTAKGNCAKPAVALDGDIYAMPIVGGYRGNLAVRLKVSVNGQEMVAVLDSGANHTLIFHDAAVRAGLAMKGREVRIAGIGGKSAATIANVGTLVVGPLTFSNEKVIVDDENIGRADMLLGFDFLRKVHAWISNSSHQLILQYPPLPSPAIGGSN